MTTAPQVPLRTLILMLKAPRPGLVKTRLAEAIGAENAAALYRSFVEHLSKQLVGESEPGWERVVAYTPADAEKELRDWLEPRLPQGVIFRPQREGDLGARLREQFESAFQTGSRAVLAIGADCLDLTASEIETCFSDLQQHDVVLGEAQDGGYWVIGMSGPHFGLFDDMPWSQADLARRTREKATKLGLSVAEQSLKTDIDRLEDLEGLKPEIREAAGLDERLWKKPSR